MAFGISMDLLPSNTKDSVGVNVHTASLRCVLNALGTLPDLKMERAGINIMTDDASAVFEYKGYRFELYTPFSDYWIDKPEGCPDEIFREVVSSLENYRVRWWERMI